MPARRTQHASTLEASLRELLERLSTPAIVSDAGGRITFGNAAATALFQPPDGDLTGLDLRDAGIFGEVRDATEEPDAAQASVVAHTARTGESNGDIRVVLERPGVDDIHLVAETVPLRLDADEREVLVLYRDVTHERTTALQYEWARHEIVRARDEAYWELEVAKLLHSITQIALSGAAPEALAQRSVEMLATNLVLRACSIWVATVDGQSLYPYGHVGFGVNEMSVALDDTGSDAARAFIRGIVLARENTVTDDLPPESIRVMQLLGTEAKSYCILPLESEGKRIGVLILVWPEPRHFDPHELQGYQSLASVVALGLRRALLNQELTDEAALVEGANEILNSALVSASTEELGAVALSVVERLTQSQFGFVGLLNDENRMRDVAISDPGRDACLMPEQAGHELGTMQCRITGLYGHVLKSGASYFTNDPAHSEFSAGTPEGHPPITSFLGTPVHEGGRVSGMIGVSNRIGGYGEQQVRILESLAPAVQTAIQRRRAADELDRTAKVLQAHLQNTPLAVIGFDGDFRVTEWSPSAQRIFGWTADEIIGRRITDFPWVYEEDVELVDAEMGAFISEHRPQRQATNRNYRKDGSVAWIEWYSSALYEDGELESILALALDITEQVRTQEALRESKERANALVRYAPTGIFEIGFHPSRFLAVNDAMSALSGYSREELLAMDPAELLDESSRERFEARLRRASVQDPLGQETEYDVVRKDGTVITVALNVQFVIDDDGQPVSAFVIGHDVTERRELEDSLRAREQRQAFLVSLGDELRACDDADCVRRITARLLGEHLQADRVSIAEKGVDGPVVAAEYVSPNAVEPVGVTEDAAPLDVELERDGGHVLSLAVTRSTNSEWQPDEVALAEDVARRCWESAERARAEEHLRQSLSEANALRDMAVAVSSSLNSRALAERVLDVTRDVLGATMGAVMLLQSPEGPAGMYSMFGVEVDPDQTIELDDTTLSGRAMLNGRVETAFTSQLPPTSREYAANVVEEHRHAAIPIFRRGEISGAITLGFRGSADFTYSELALFDAISRHLSIGLENAYLFETQKLRRRRIEALHGVMEAAVSPLEPGAVAQAVLEYLTENQRFDFADIWLAGGAALELVACVGYPPAFVENFSPMSLDAPYDTPKVFNSRKTIVAAALETTNPLVVAMFESVGVKLGAYVIMPLTSRGNTIGTIRLGWHEAYALNEYDLDFYESIASEVAVALDNARLYDQERESARLGAALADLDGDVHSSLDFEQIAKRALSGAAAAIGADRAAISEGTGCEWEVTFQYGFDTEDPGELQLHEIPQVALAARAGQPVAIEDIQSDETPGGEHAKSWGVRSLAASPMKVRSSTAGVVMFGYSNQEHRFTESEIDFVNRVASSLALAKENARLYELEHHIAETLQETLIVVPAQVPGITFSRAYESASLETGRVGGDFVDVFEIHGGLVALVTGDVSGKGIEAAVVTSLVRNTVRAHCMDGLGLHDVLGKTNRVVYHFTESETFVTMFLAVLDVHTGVVRYASAGHPPALLVHDGEVREELLTRNPILGALEHATFYDSQTVAAPGDQLVLYTDGVIEARAPGVPGFFDLDGLRLALSKHKDTRTSRLAKRLLAEVVRFSDGVLRDDAAILVAEPTIAKPTYVVQPQLEFD